MSADIGGECPDETPFARPVFAWSHHAVMKQGGVGLAKALAAPLVAQSSG